LGLALRILETAALLATLMTTLLAALARLRVALLLLAALTRFRVLTLLLLARLSHLLFVLTHCVSPRNFGGWKRDYSRPVDTTFVRRNCSGACHIFAMLRYAKHNI
jgi:hypothetical protein